MMPSRSWLFITSIFLALAFTACEDCRGLFGNEKLDCANGGTCNEGECDCLKGYYGKNCELVDECERLDVFCFRGACEDGLCFCDPGYEGEDCSLETRAKFIGEYNVVESCLNLDTTWNYNITIERDLLDGQVMRIGNLFSFDNFPINGFFSKVDAVGIQGTNNFRIPNQRPDDGEKTIQGEGSIEVIDENTTNITINYTTTNKNKSWNCVLEGVLNK